MFDRLKKLLGSDTTKQSIQQFNTGSEQDKIAQIGRGITGIKQALNPFDDESRGNRLVDSTSNQFGATDAFKNILSSTNPYFGGGLKKARGLKDESNAAGLYKPHSGYYRDNSRLWVSEDNPDAEQVMHHEGLHGAWDKTSSQDRANFINMADTYLPQNTVSRRPIPYKNAEVGVRNYLDKRLDGYRAKSGKLDFRTADPSIQNEIHSYIPEYYETSGKQMPQQLAQYYSKYYQPGAYNKTQNTIRSLQPQKPYTILDLFEGY